MNWMTVKELAEYLKLSEVMIYKLAQKGEIPASKIGSAWRFAQAEIDGWLMNQRGEEWQLSEPANIVVRNIVGDIGKKFGDGLCTVIVFGSFARRDVGGNSDLDVLVVLKSIDENAQRIISDIAYANTYGKDIPLVVAPVVMNESEYLTETSPLLINVRKEGRKVF